MGLHHNPIAIVEYVCWFDPAVDRDALARPLEPEVLWPDGEGGKRRATGLDEYLRKRDRALLPMLADAQPTVWRLRRLTHRQLAEVLSQDGLQRQSQLALRYGLHSVSNYMVGEPGKEQALTVRHERGPLGEWADDATMDTIPPEVWLDVGIAVVTLSRLEDPFRRG